MKRYIKTTFGLFLGLTLLTSCDDLFEVEPEEVLLSSEYLGDDEIDARSALFGVLSQMQEAAGQYLVLGEMRADLVDVNENTEDELRQLNNLEINNDNSFIDPTNLFSIINNCNFALVGIDTEAFENRLLEDYASIMRIRTWAQMQILINYGKLPYNDRPIRTDDDFVKEYPLLDFNQALDQMIRNLQAISEIENVSKHDDSLGFSIEEMIPDNDILLGDLFLWRGDYISAAIHYKRFLDNVDDGGPQYTLSNFRTIVEEEGGRFTILVNKGIFENDTPQTSEVIKYIGYSEEFRQKNIIYDIVTTQMKPSEAIRLNWRSQSLAFEGGPINSIVKDQREIRSTNEENPQLIGKYQEEYFIWNRAAKIYLRYAEAINYAGYPEHALTLLNGVFNDPDLFNPIVNPVNTLLLNNPESFLNFDLPGYFTYNDAGEPISGLFGVRHRAGLAPEQFLLPELTESERLNEEADADGNGSVTNTEELIFREGKLTQADKINQVGALILNEAALELAFEGNRWQDLVRYSLRGGKDIITNALFNKFNLSGSAGQAENIRQKLLDESNWFLPLTIPSNFIAQE